MRGIGETGLCGCNTDVPQRRRPAKETDGGRGKKDHRMIWGRHVGHGDDARWSLQPQPACVANRPLCASTVAVADVARVVFSREMTSVPPATHPHSRTLSNR